MIFLDVRNDVYFRISPRLERAFNASIEGTPCIEADAGSLISRGLLVEEPAMAAPSSVAVAPTRSAVEEPHGPQELRLQDVLETLWITGSMRFQMRVRKLHQILRALEDFRRTHAPISQGNIDKQRELSLRSAAHAFLRARRYAPVETRCLLDSLAMTRYLARRGHHVRIVFGVTEDPFAAHCWVQAGDLLLSDAIGNVETYTPIWTF